MKKKIWYLCAIIAGSLAIVIIVLIGCGSPKMPASHFVDGAFRSSYHNCLGCHQSGDHDAPKAPAGHVIFNNDSCTKCHKPPD
jgi:hypothetical protein